MRSSFAGSAELLDAQRQSTSSSHTSSRLLTKETNIEPAVVLYCLVLGLKGTVILNGTQSHLQSDLEGLNRVRNWARKNEYEWASTQKHFNDIIGENY